MENYESNPLWLILVETAKNLPLYNAHKAYVRDTIFPENPDVSAEELSHRLNMPIGEALVILWELNMNQTT